MSQQQIEQLRPQFRLIQLGVVAAVLALACCTAALVSYPADAGNDIAFPIGTAVCAGVLLVICVLQLVLWTRTNAGWRAGQPLEPGPAVRTSWWAHLLSYPVLLVGLYLSIEASALGGFSDLPGFFLGLAAILMLVAQVSAAVQFLRADGPPGTVPHHLRRLLAWVQSQR